MTYTCPKCGFKTKYPQIIQRHMDDCNKTIKNKLYNQ